MIREVQFLFGCLVLVAGLVCGCSGAKGNQGPTPLQTIQNPGGGQIVFGAVDGQTTEAGAMGSILRRLHQQYSDKPKVGRVFQVRGTDSAAVFFTLVKRNQDNAQIAGMVIASQTGPTAVEAALLSDDASRFNKTVNPMLKTLFAQWHPGNVAAVSAGATAQASSSAPATALRPVTLPDNSASIGLPAEWKIQQGSGGGTILAEGPNGEAVALDFPMLAMNSNDPRVRQTMAFAQGAGRNTAYAHSLYYPYGQELSHTFVDLLQMMRRMHGQPPVWMKVEQVSAAPSAPGSRCARLTGHTDPQDGKGLREFSTVFCSGPLSAMGNYMNIAFHSTIPVAVADKQRATVNAVVASFKVNNTVVNQQAVALAAPAIAQIHAIGRAATERIERAHAEEDAHNRSVEERWDSQDKRNQAFSNYLLDQSVIRDEANSGHATVWNERAEELVNGNPSRFSYVETPGFWKGIDY